MTTDVGRRTTSTRRHLAAALLALTVTCLAFLAGAAQAPATIFDSDAAPSLWSLISSPGALNDEARGVAISGGATFVAGTLRAPSGNADASLTRFDGGTLTWTKTWDSPSHLHDQADFVARGPGGVMYTAGSSQITVSDMQLVLLKRSATTGKLLWKRSYNDASQTAYVTGMGVDRRGNVTVVSTGSDAKGHTIWIVRSWSPTGAVRWTRSVGGPGVKGYSHGWPKGLVTAKDGSVYVTGFQQQTLPGLTTTAVTVRFSADGKRLWQRRYGGPEGLPTFANALALRPGGGVYVCGYTVTAATGADGMVLSYTAAGGRTAFALAAGPDGQVFNALAVTSTGHVVAAGSSTGSGTKDTYYVVYTSAGAFSSSAVRGGVGHDEWNAVGADAFGGFYLVGTQYLSATQRIVVVSRRSTITSGGMFDSSWGAVYNSVSTQPYAIAVRGTTLCAVGMVANNVAGSLDDQFVLTWIW